LQSEPERENEHLGPDVDATKTAIACELRMMEQPFTQNLGINSSNPNEDFPLQLFIEISWIVLSKIPFQIRPVFFLFPSVPSSERSQFQPHFQY
jgi:hypothetical protein